MSWQKYKKFLAPDRQKTWATLLLHSSISVRPDQHLTSVSSTIARSPLHRLVKDLTHALAEVSLIHDSVLIQIEHLQELSPILFLLQASNCRSYFIRK